VQTSVRLNSLQFLFRECEEWFRTTGVEDKELDGVIESMQRWGGGGVGLGRRYARDALGAGLDLVVDEMAVRAFGAVVAEAMSAASRDFDAQWAKFESVIVRRELTRLTPCPPPSRQVGPAADAAAGRERAARAAREDVPPHRRGDGGDPPPRRRGQAPRNGAAVQIRAQAPAGSRRFPS
jgi:hypothetical protein